MSNIDKQWLQHKIADMEAIRDDIPFGLGEDGTNTLAALRIALASLEAEPAIHRWRRVTSEPYGPYPWHYGDFIGFSKPVDGIEDEYFYFAPPAPAPAKAKAEPVAWLWSHRKHPSEVTLVRPEDDEMAEVSGWSGWSCQALYAAPPAPVSVPDAMEMDDDFDSAFEHGKAVGWNAFRAAMLQGTITATQFKPVADLYGLTSPTGGETSFTFDAVEARDFIDGGWSCQEYVELERFQEAVSGNSPVIPDGWVACSERMPEDDDFVYIWPRPDFGVELHVAQYGKFDKRDAGWYAQVYEQNYGIEYYPVRVTHWMPLPAAPQQEA
ncbi:DUF551 domain-containing protein [Enterobacter roggenkampii]|uniref:DUF551 domain-containing protein n=1 Tax=Enterobacter roggenkampii TaxID=1812935 RepID=UPI003CE47BC0